MSFSSEQVTEWMRAHKAGAAEAAREFGLPYERVKKWAQRAGLSRHGREVKPKAGEQGGKGGGPKATVRPSRAREPVPMADEVRAGLTKAVEHGVAIMSDREWVEANPAGYASLAQGLKNLVSVAPDILALPGRLKAGDTQGDTAPADLAAAMGVDLNAPPTLTVLTGDRREKA